MENRRTFLKRVLPRLMVAGSVFALRPSAWVFGHPPSAVDLDQARYVKLLEELRNKHGFQREELHALFGQVLLRPEIIEKFERPAEILPYYRYRRIFIKDSLITKAREYLRENRSLFKEVETSYGVDKEIICSILGVESKFGEKGLQRYRVFDVLNTAFSQYPRRERFYRGELIEFLLLSREEKIDPFSVMGSYAGAFGVPQFIPSSFRSYAVDYDRDGLRDLWDSKGDILASVANYLRNFKWQFKGLIRLPASVNTENEAVQAVLGGGLRSKTPVSNLLSMGVRIDPPPREDEEVSLVSYEPMEGDQRVLAVFGNFRALTRYNYSINYALVITEMAERLVGAADG